MINRFLCMALVLTVALFASVGCACCRRTACYSPTTSASPCCNDLAAPAAPVPVQSYSPAVTTYPH